MIAQDSPQDCFGPERGGPGGEVNASAALHAHWGTNSETLSTLVNPTTVTYVTTASPPGESQLPEPSFKHNE